MYGYTQAEAAKEIRAEARLYGLTFKKQNSTINSKQAYKFTDRKTGETKAKNYTFWSAYEAFQNGDVANFASDDTWN